MRRTEWRRLAGICALSALALHGISALALPSGLGIWIDGDSHDAHVMSLLPLELPIGELPAPTVIGSVTATSGHVVALTVSRRQVSRGPPA